MHKLTPSIASKNSPLKNPPLELSRKQVLLLDGLRYSAEMSNIAYERLFEKLQTIAIAQSSPSTREIAETMLDAWSVVDAVHRFVDLAGSTPGLCKQGPWFRLLKERTSDALELRNDVQHLDDAKRLQRLIEQRGQIWGYLSWAEVKDDGNYTGNWLMISPGTVYVGDQWFFIGPAKPKFKVPIGHIRLNAFSRQVYLGRCVWAVNLATNHISAEVAAGRIRPIGSPAHDRRGADMLVSGAVEVLRSSSQKRDKT